MNPPFISIFAASSIWPGVRITNERLPKILGEVSKLLDTGYHNGSLPSLGCEGH